MEGQRVKIELSEEEVAVFQWCWKHYDIFKTAMNMKSAKLILNLDCKGNAKPEFHFFKKEGIDNAFGHTTIK